MHLSIRLLTLLAIVCASLPADAFLGQGKNQSAIAERRKRQQAALEADLSRLTIPFGVTAPGGVIVPAGEYIPRDGRLVLRPTETLTFHHLWEPVGSPTSFYSFSVATDPARTAPDWLAALKQSADGNGRWVPCIRNRQLVALIYGGRVFYVTGARSGALPRDLQ